MSSVQPVKRPTFRVGDNVRVVVPDLFVRVGYPLTKMIAIETVENEYATQIQAFVQSVVSKPIDLDHNPAVYALHNGVVSALASWWLRERRFGGRERKIYTQRDDGLAGTQGWQVLSKRVVKTGTYNAGGMISGGWDYEPDYEPPHLGHETSHVLLSLLPPSLGLSMIEIEAVNVEHCNE